jgi:hypothetical protein
MKKTRLAIVSVVIVIALMLATSPANALKLDTGRDWNTGSPVEIDLTAAPGPVDWQLLGQGVVVDAPASLCYPFREGEFGWTGAIYQLVDGKWNKLPTTNGWIPDKEGEFMACAVAPAAGTYALFQYYTKPAKAGCSIDTSDWYVSYFYAPDYPELYPGVEGWYLDAYVPGLPVGTLVKYSIITPDPNLLISESGSTHSYLYKGAYIWADFVDSGLMEWEGDWMITVKITAGDCSIIYDLYSGSD